MLSDTTAQTAIDNVMIMEAIKAGDISSYVECLDEDIAQQHIKEIDALKDMKEDYQMLQNSFRYLVPEDADMFRKYLNHGSRSQVVIDEVDRSSDAIRKQLMRCRKTIISYTENDLSRKYLSA